MNKSLLYRRRRCGETLLSGAISLVFAATSAHGGLGLTVQNGVLMKDGRPYRGIGANYNTLFGRILQNKDDRSSLENLSRLAKAGIPFVRFRACGFKPENYQLYLHNRPEYFRRMDLVVHCAEENKIGLIPSLFWRLSTVSEVVGEDRGKLDDPRGRAAQFLQQYTREMVSRNNSSPAIWGWEFGNESNLGVDLGGPRRGRRAPLFGFNPTASNQLRSEQLRTVLAQFAQTVRAIDGYRIIESGTCLPRPAAWHMARRQPGRDSVEQSFSSLLSLTPDPMDVISIHAYEKAKDNYPEAHSIADVLRAVTRSAAAVGKPVFVGEFPVRTPAQAQEFIQAIEAARVPLSAFWVFDLPQQEATLNVSFDNQRAFAVDMIARANRDLQKQ